MERRNDASTNLTGNAVTGEANQPESNASTAMLDDDTSQLEEDLLGLNLDNESNQLENIESNVNNGREIGDLHLERTDAETIDLQVAVSTPGAGEGTTQLSGIHSTAEAGNQPAIEPAIEPQNKPRDEYIKSYAEKLVQESHNENLFILCQEVLTNKRHNLISGIVGSPSVPPVKPSNTTFTIVLWNVNGKTIPDITPDTTRERNGNDDACVYSVLGEHIDKEDIRGIADIRTMVPSKTPSEVGFKWKKDPITPTTWESLPEDEIEKWFKRMDVVLCNDILFVSWHGYRKVKMNKNISNVDLMMKVVLKIQEDQKSRAVIIGGDFNIDAKLIEKHFPNYKIFPPKKPRNNNIDFVVTWPKDAFILENCIVDESPTFTHPEGKKPVFDHNIVKYILKMKETVQQNQSASSSQYYNIQCYL